MHDGNVAISLIYRERAERYTCDPVYTTRVTLCTLHVRPCVRYTYDPVYATRVTLCMLHV